MPKSVKLPAATSPQQIAAQYSQSTASAAATQAATTYNYRLLQNAYNPYSQQGYLSSMKQTLQDWQLEKEYFINGEWMSMEEFVNFLYPEDCAEKTFLVLKLTGKKEEDKK